MMESFSGELFKLRKRPAVWALAAIWVGMAIFFSYLLPYLLLDAGTPASGELAPLLPGSLVASALSGFPLFGGAIALVLGTLAAGDEYSWSTLKVILTERPNRFSVLSGKLLALGAALGGFVLAVFVADTVCSLTVALLEGAAWTWPSLGGLVAAVGAGWLILAAWAMLGFLLATLLRGSAFALGIGLIYALLIEVLIGGFSSQSEALGGLQEILLGANAGSLAAALGSPPQAQGGAPGVVTVAEPAQAISLLTAYVVIFVVLVILLFRRDVTQ
jgi:ABC-type transport system involved in multi-copper enzyme maturation permease subunit